MYGVDCRYQILVPMHYILFCYTFQLIMYHFKRFVRSFSLTKYLISNINHEFVFIVLVQKDLFSTLYLPTHNDNMLKEIQIIQ